VTKIAKKLLHKSGTELPLKEDLKKEGSAKVSGHAGKIIGGIIGDALFDDVGGEIGEEIGDKVGKLLIRPHEVLSGILHRLVLKEAFDPIRRLRQL
jgi:hypothetical protein